MVYANAVDANVTMAGVEHLANAAAPLTHANLQMERFAQDMEHVDVVDANVKSEKTLDIQENTVKSVQHVQVVVTN